MTLVKNTFVKSKMNKDLDDRLLSNGEYRNAQNVNISRSEGEDVGALENVLGNKLISDFGLSSVNNLEIIGYYRDESNNRAFFMATNYTDESTDNLSNVAPYAAFCYVLMRDFKNNTNDILVQGRFLNFSKTHHIFGIDLIEDLLFWTDNRNQPRKINVTKAIASVSHYTTEDQISVAKYYPYQVPYLYKTFTLTGTTPNTGVTFSATSVADLRIGMQLKISKVNNLPVFVQNINCSANQFTVSQTVTLTASQVFMYPSSQNTTDAFITPSSSVKFVSIAASGSNWEITFSNPVSNFSLSPNMAVTSPENINEEVLTILQTGTYTVVVDKNITTGVNTVAANDLIEFADPNPNYNDKWPGDPDFLRDKFVRFAYRFKFEDGEYSIISPFTQPAFIPKQDGYIRSEIGTGSNATDYISQEEQIRRSTILEFFENKVQEVLIQIPTPYAVNALDTSLKVSDIDILYKESDGVAIKLIESIPVTDTIISGNSTKLLEYTYQSKRPIRTLPEREITRVFDQVPIRAMTQSSVGNRIIYGNIINKHTPPETLNFNTIATPKYYINNAASSYCTVAYPNHTLKQNRTYQIGVVLADRYGRQSDVILSAVTSVQYTLGGINYGGSTLFHPYKSASDTSIPTNWFGDSLKILFRDEIPSTVTYADGYPGLYQEPQITGTVTTNTSGTEFVVQTISNYEVGDTIQIPDGSGGRGTITSIIAVNTSSSTITVADEITPAATAPYSVTIYKDENKLGWYSYKIVVNQMKQEYYNAYLPNILSGNPLNANDAFKEGFTTLISDNVNKIPSDLEEIQPEQTQFRTSDVLLYPRVAGTGANDYSIQYNLDNHYITVDTIGKLGDMQPSGFAAGPPISASGIYDTASNPPIARLSTYNKKIGGDQSAEPTLGIVEIDPLESRLEIYYETSTSGLISELNAAIAAGSSATPTTPTPPASTS